MLSSSSRRNSVKKAVNCTSSPLSNGSKSSLYSSTNFLAAASISLHSSESSFHKFKLCSNLSSGPGGPFCDVGASAVRLKKAGFIDESWTRVHDSSIKLINTYSCDYRFY